MSALQPLLIEIGTEELPPLEMRKLRDALFNQLSEQFAAANISFSATQHICFSKTPSCLVSRYSSCSAR
jgi:glycyl-tRNA synthetase beta subunit